MWGKVRAGIVRAARGPQAQSVRHSAELIEVLEGEENDQYMLINFEYNWLISRQVSRPEAWCPFYTQQMWSMMTCKGLNTTILHVKELEGLRQRS